MIRFFTILFLLSVACSAQVKQWHLTNTTGNVQTQINNRLRIDGGTNILSAKLTIEGALTQDVEFNDIARLDLDSTDASVSGVASIYIDGGITTLRGVTNLQVITPGVHAGTATAGQVLRLSNASEGDVEFATPSVAGFTFDATRNNITLGDDNAIVDTNPGTEIVTLLGSGGSLPNRIGSSSHTIAGIVASGTVVARRTYWVSGSTGQVTYNAVAYNPGDTFTGVYGVKTFSATGNAGVKDNLWRQADSSYTAGTAYVSSILGGYDHLNNQIAGTIGGGGHNILYGGFGGNHSTIGGGSYHFIRAGVYAGIFTGTQNQTSQDFGLIGGGWGNWITSDNVSSADESVIVNGQEGQIQDVGYGFIGTGLNNRITNPNNTASMNYNTILNGTGSQIIGGVHNFSHGLNQTIQGDSGGYNAVFGANQNVGGTSTYNYLFGSSTVSTNSTRLLSVGTINNVTSLSDAGAILGNNGTITSASYAYQLGNANTINGTTYTFLLGQSLSSADLASPVVNANYGMAQGYQAVIRSYGQRVESNGNESTVNVQRSRYLLKRRAAHTTGTDLQLRLDGSIEFPYVPTNSVWTCRAAITAVQSDGVKYGSWTLDFAVRDTGGTLSVLGSPSSVVVHDGHSTSWTISAGVRSDATYRGIVLNARALTGETVTWGASMDAMELNGAW
jgi:hypothetical protein